KALVGQILIHPATCVPAFYPSDKYLLESMKENRNAPVLTAEDMQYFWGNSFSFPSPLICMDFIFFPHFFHNGTDGRFIRSGRQGKGSLCFPTVASHFDGLPPACTSLPANNCGFIERRTNLQLFKSWDWILSETKELHMQQH